VNRILARFGQPSGSRSLSCSGHGGGNDSAAANNLTEKGRAQSRTGPGGPAPGPPRPANAPRQGAGGPGVAVYGGGNQPVQKGSCRATEPLFLGTQGIMTTVERGEGVQLLPSSAGKSTPYPYRFDPVTRTHDGLGPLLQGRDASCSNFSVSGPYAEWMLLGVIALPCAG